jgi:2-polyprenyl-3-methyl-5-hydroxy-6-metoxy-1,4-benzoquinol methylase
MKINYYISERKEVAKFIDKNSGKILDVGCGVANFLNFFKKKGFETWGIEPVKDIANIAKNKADKILNETIESALPILPDNYFDYITFNDVLEHTKDPWIVLEKLKTKFNIGGKILASIPNVRFYTNLLNLFFKKDWKYEDVGILDKTHLRFFTKKSMVRLFTDSGYVVDKIIVINGPRKIHIRFITTLFNILTLGLFSDILYPQYLIVAIPLKNEI